MIKPTIGRIVWYRPDKYLGEEPRAAIITRVDGDRAVGLAVFYRDSLEFVQHAALVQDVDEPPLRGAYCEWMPYQKGQAAKTETLEKALSAK